MARNETFVAAPPETVFDVLADPRTYAHWVVGSREIRDADESWPEPGSAFHHTVGMPPLHIKDATIVERSKPPVMLQLQAKARPLPSARIQMRRRPEGEGTRVVMIEAPASRLLNVLAGPVGHAMI